MTTKYQIFPKSCFYLNNIWRWGCGIHNKVGNVETWLHKRGWLREIYLRVPASKTLYRINWLTNGNSNCHKQNQHNLKILKHINTNVLYLIITFHFAAFHICIFIYPLWKPMFHWGHISNLICLCAWDLKDIAMTRH